MHGLIIRLELIKSIVNSNAILVMKTKVLEINILRQKGHIKTKDYRKGRWRN